MQQLDEEPGFLTKDQFINIYLEKAKMMHEVALRALESEGMADKRQMQLEH